MTKTIPVIKPEEVLELLKNGYTRFKKDNDGSFTGSIQEKYNLSDAETKRLFRHPLLKAKKTKVPGFVFSDEVPATVVTTATVTPVAGFTEPSAPAQLDEKLFD